MTTMRSLLLATGAAALIVGTQLAAQAQTTGPAQMPPSTVPTEKSAPGITTPGSSMGKQPGSTQMQRSPTMPRNGAAAGADNGLNAQASAPANLSAEQRSKISGIIRTQNVKSTQVNFNVSVGTKVPKSLHLTPLPRDAVTVYPAWRGYDFIVVSGQIVVINPRTLTIVAVIEA